MQVASLKSEDEQQIQKLPPINKNEPQIVGSLVLIVEEAVFCGCARRGCCWGWRLRSRGRHTTYRMKRNSDHNLIPNTTTTSLSSSSNFHKTAFPSYESCYWDRPELVAHVQFNQRKAQLGMIGPAFLTTLPKKRAEHMYHTCFIQSPTTRFGLMT